MTPNLNEEIKLYHAGHMHIAGIDEAGRGAWAGPVCAAAVVLPLDQIDLQETLTGVRDSKCLTPATREHLLATIQTIAWDIGVGWASAQEVNTLGIVKATRQAMIRALDELQTPVTALILDYMRLPTIDLPQRAFPKADDTCLSVAAASIVAKVSRDQLMVTLDRQFPGYGLAQHKGYGTRQHHRALHQLGPCPIHRTSWRPFRKIEGGPS